MIVATLPAGLADLPGQGAVELRSRPRRWTGCRACPLEPLQAQRVAGAVGQHPGERGSRSGPAGAWASTRSRSHIGAEQNHLWPVQQVRPRPAAGNGLGPGGVRPDVAAALLLGHGHPGQQAAACPSGGAQRRGRRRGGEQRLEPGGQARGRARSGGHHRVGHRDGAAMPGLGLGPDVEASRRPGDVGAGPRGRPRARRAGRGRRRWPSARARRGGTRPRRCGCPYRSWAAHRRVLVGQAGLVLGLARLSTSSSKLVQFWDGGPLPRRLALYRLEQRGVGGHVVTRQQRDLVPNLVGNVRRGGGLPGDGKPRGGPWW